MKKKKKKTTSNPYVIPVSEIVREMKYLSFSETLIDVPNEVKLQKSDFLDQLSESYDNGIVFCFAVNKSSDKVIVGSRMNGTGSLIDLAHMGGKFVTHLLSCSASELQGLECFLKIMTNALAFARQNVPSPTIEEKPTSVQIENVNAQVEQSRPTLLYEGDLTGSLSTLKNFVDDNKNIAGLVFLGSSVDPITEAGATAFSVRSAGNDPSVLADYLLTELMKSSDLHTLKANVDFSHELFKQMNDKLTSNSSFFATV